MFEDRNIIEFDDTNNTYNKKMYYCHRDIYERLTHIHDVFTNYTKYNEHEWLLWVDHIIKYSYYTQYYYENYFRKYYIKSLPLSIYKMIHEDIRTLSRNEYFEAIKDLLFIYKIWMLNILEDKYKNAKIRESKDIDKDFPNVFITE